MEWKQESMIREKMTTIQIDWDSVYTCVQLKQMVHACIFKSLLSMMVSIMKSLPPHKLCDKLVLVKNNLSSKFFSFESSQNKTLTRPCNAYGMKANQNEWHLFFNKQNVILGCWNIPATWWSVGCIIITHNKFCKTCKLSDVLLNQYDGMYVCMPWWWFPKDQ